MIKEQEEAIEMFKELEMCDDKEFVNARETILSMLEEKDKIIDLMVEEIDKNIGSVCPFIDYHYDLNCKNECKDDYKKCWKKFFENKAKEK